MTWLLAIFTVAVTPYEVTVQTRGGTAVRGVISEWNDSAIEILPEDGSTQRILREKIARITFSNEAAQPVNVPKLRAQLVDGSTVPADACTWNGADFEFAGIIGEKGGEWRWTLPAEGIRAIRFNLDDANQDQAWRELVDRKRTSDWLVVYRKKQDALDYVEGVLDHFSSEGVTIRLEDEPTTIPIDKVFGIVFYRRTDATQSQRTLNVRGQQGLSLAGCDVRLGPEKIEIDLSIGGTVAVQASDIKDIEFLSDDVLYLSDLEPIAGLTNWQPYFPLPVDSPLLRNWGLPRRDQSFSGERLQLLVRDASGKHELRECDRGLAMRSGSEITYQLPSGYKTLNLLVGMDPAAHADSDAVLLIEIDGRSAGEWRMARSEPAQEIEIDVTEKQRLRLLVDFGSGTDTGDVIHLCEPRLQK